jgi:hypothetical protein
MKVWITLDMIDGSKSQLKGPVYLDEVDIWGLKLYLNRAGVAGVSFVRADLLNRLDKMEEEL